MKNFLPLVLVMFTLLLACKNKETKNALQTDLVETEPQVVETMYSPQEKAEDKIDWVGHYKGNLVGTDIEISLKEDKSGEISIHKGKKYKMSTFQINFDNEGYFEAFVDGENHEYKIVDGGILDVNTMMENMGKEGMVNDQIEKKFTLFKK